MSRGYVVNWQRASCTVSADDRCELQIDLLGILPEGDMTDLLKAALSEAGFREEDGTLSLQLGAVRAILSEDGRRVEIVGEAQQTVVGTGTTLAQAQQNAQEASKSEKGSLQTKVASAVLAAEPRVREIVQAALKEVYLRALQRKAKTMGTVQGVTESTSADGTVEIVIKVMA